MHATIALPDSAPTITLATTPQFRLQGLVASDGTTTVTAVDLYADGTRIATLTPGPATLGVRTWTHTTSAPPGTHTLVACARTPRGDVASEPRTVRVIAPPPTATIPAPTLHELTAAEAGALTRVSATELAFEGATGLYVGTIVTGAPSRLAPDGLLRRVTGLRTVEGGTVATTVPARMQDALWQAHLQLRQSLTPLHWSGTRTFRSDDARGKVELLADVDYTARLALDVDLRITPEWAWARTPRTTQSMSRFTVSGSVDAPVDLRFTGKGSLYQEAEPVELPMAPLLISTAPRIWVQPRGLVGMGIEADVGDDLRLTGTITDRMAARLDTPYAPDTHRPGGSVSFFSSGHPDVTYRVAIVSLRASVSLRTDASPGPRYTTWAKDWIEVDVPCPGRASILGDADSVLDGVRSWDPRKWTVRHGNGYWVIMAQSMTSCPDVPLQVRTLRLPATVAGAPVTARAYGEGGVVPYSWRASGLPDGVGMAADGTVTGTPTRPGRYLATLTLTDATGRSQARRVPMLVTAPGTLTAASRPGDAYRLPDGRWESSVTSWGHSGCTLLDAAERCARGGWASLGAPWIGVDPWLTWDRPLVTVTRTVTARPGQAGEYRLSVLADETATVRLDGATVAEVGGPTAATEATEVVVHLHEGANRLEFELGNLFLPGGLSWVLEPAG
ncbi:MAG: PKD domain-containing protein [Kineosporiaceae bacterium]